MGILSLLTKGWGLLSMNVKLIFFLWALWSPRESPCEFLQLGSRDSVSVPVDELRVPI